MDAWLRDAAALQLVWTFLALAGARALPGRGLGERLGLGPGRLGAARLAFAAAGFVALSNALHRAIVAFGLHDGTALAELERLVREARGWNLLGVALWIGLAPALAEELLFRGLVLRWLAVRVAAPAAVLGSAALFGAAHLEPAHAAAAFPLGAYLGVLAWRSGSLRGAILCHGVNNVLALLGARGIVPQPGGAHPALAALGLALAGACLWLALRPLQARRPPADPDRGPHDVHTSGPDRRRW